MACGQRIGAAAVTPSTRPPLVRMLRPLSPSLVPAWNTCAVFAASAEAGNGIRPSHNAEDSRRMPAPRSRRRRSENFTSVSASVPPARRLHDGQQVAFQQGQHHLRLRVAEAAVVLDDLGAVWDVSISPKYRQPWKVRPSAFMAAMVGRKIVLHARAGPSPRCSRDWGQWCPCRRCSGPGRRPGRACGPWRIPWALTVFPSVKARTRHLRPGEELLNDHPAAGHRRSALSTIMERSGVLRLLPGLADEHALAQGQAVGLDDHGDAAAAAHRPGPCPDRQTLHRRRWECRIFSSDPWQTPCCSRCWRPSCPGRRQGMPFSRSGSTSPRAQGIVRRHHGEVHALPSRQKSDNGRRMSVALMGTHMAVGRHAAVARQRHRALSHAGIFQQLFGNGVFASAAAYNQDLHAYSSNIIRVLWPMKRSMMEQAHTGEAHHHVVFVAGVNHVIVPDGAAGLGHILHAAAVGALDVVAKGEEGIGAQGRRRSS